MLNTRLASRVKPDWDARQWDTVPLILSQNVVKDAYNERVAHAFAAKTGRTLHYYYAVDRHRKVVIKDPNLRSHLQQMSSGTTNQ